MIQLFSTFVLVDSLYYILAASSHVMVNLQQFFVDSSYVLVVSPTDMFLIDFFLFCLILTSQPMQ